MSKETSAGAVIFRKQDSKIYYLLLHYKAGPASPSQGGHWDFPKGNVEEGEKEEETARREVAEETGIKDIKIIKGFKEWIKYVYRRTYDLEKPASAKATAGREETRLRRGFGLRPTKSPSTDEVGGQGKKADWVFKIVTFYLAETKTKEVKISFEHIGYKWLSYEKSLEQLTFKNAKEILKKAHHYQTLV